MWWEGRQHAEAPTQIWAVSGVRKVTLLAQTTMTVMETRIRVRVGDLEVECVGDEAFVLERSTGLISQLIDLLCQGCHSTRGPRVSPGPTPGEAVLVSIAGTVRDYWSTEPVPHADLSITSSGFRVSGQSDDQGRFVLSGRSVAGDGSLAVAASSGFVETVTPLELNGQPLTRDAFVVTRSDVARQFATLGTAPVLEGAIVIVHLFDVAGKPLEMLPLTDISLTGNDGPAAGDGPYFFGIAGDLQGQDELFVSRAFDGRARAAFLNVPPGKHTLAITARNGEGLIRTVIAVEVHDGATVLEAQLRD